MLGWERREPALEFNDFRLIEGIVHVEERTIVGKISDCIARNYLHVREASKLPRSTHRDVRIDLEPNNSPAVPLVEPIDDYSTFAAADVN